MANFLAELFRKIYDLLWRRIGRVWYTLPSRFAENSSQIYGNLPPNTRVRENTNTSKIIFMALYEIYDPRFEDQTGAASARMVYALSLFRKNSLEIHGKSVPSMLSNATKYTVDCRLHSEKTLIEAGNIVKNGS